MNPADRPRFHADFSRALAFATALHAAQVRKQTDIPYISHLIAVAGLVLEHGGNGDEAIAGLLHDSIEDCAEDYPGGVAQLHADLHEQFGPAVLAIVEGCTDAETIPKPPWHERKEKYLAHLATASPSIRLVSCCDKLHNARAIVADLRVTGMRCSSASTRDSRARSGTTGRWRRSSRRACRPRRQRSCGVRWR